ncbi:DNA polymerase alpha subunit B [Trametes pubescens]|uniref:DNA polymerase alpha subunit B n=1 Tax=Trametes pubescens TaxID=154538 RepID=A0A1M2VVA0_TRAPU|nr:DNA polymerase alpha subunit B [Trametes pubescens]
MAGEVSVIEAELKSHFGDDLDQSLLAECVKVCQLYNITGERFYYKREAMRMNRPPDQFSLKDIQEVKAMIKRELDRENINKRFAKGKLSGPQSRNFARGGGTPVKPVRRQDGFDLPRFQESKFSVAGPSRVNYVGPSMDEGARKKRTYRYMYEKVSERSEVLDDRIDHFGELVKAYYDVEELGDPSAVTEEEVTVVGRIVHDADTSSGSVKLNEASLVLESSRMMGSGARVPLRFDADVKVRRGVRNGGGQGMFPGAIVALKGKNGGGGSFYVTEILSLPPLDPSSGVQVKSETVETHFSMFIACGPFTPEADLAYRPLQNLISKLKEAKPAVVLLTGPFIDATHPAIKVGDVDATPREMFQIELVNRLREFLDASPGSTVLLVPSTRDILSDHAVFPQCELPRALCNDPRIRLLPNPARFTLNGVHVAASSVDVLFHLRKEEFFKRAAEVEPQSQSPTASPEGPDAMANLCRHILQQRSFYPIFPVPLDLAHDVNLDVTHSDTLYLCPQEDETEEDGEDARNDPSRARCAPDVLVVPSRLKHFSKIVDNTVAVNPSFLTKATYAVLEYAGHGAPGPAKDRIKVEIHRLEA